MAIVTTFGAEHDVPQTDDEKELEELYEWMSAFVSAEGPDLLTRGMPPLEANRAIKACLLQLKESFEKERAARWKLKEKLLRVQNRYEIATRILDALPSYSCGMAVLAEEELSTPWKEWTDVRNQ